MLSRSAIRGAAVRVAEWARAVEAARFRVSSRDQRREIAAVAARLDLPALPPRTKRGGVWAVTMVKDEADVIESSVRHLFAQGVTGVLVADNGSSDATPQILRGLAAELNVHVATDREPAYYQATKMSLLADWARRTGATWVIPFDADEFWFAAEGTLADWLTTQRAFVIAAPIHNAFPADGGGWVIDQTPHLHPKVAFRPHRLAWLSMGNHDVTRPGRRGEGLHILHRPWRSFEQFSRKTRNGAAALAASRLASGLGSHWRDVGQLADDDQRHLWVDLLAGRDDPALGWSPIGPLIEDDLDWATWDPRAVLTTPAQTRRTRHLDVYYLRPDAPGFGRWAVGAWLVGDLLGETYRAIEPGQPLRGNRPALMVVTRPEDLRLTLAAGWRPRPQDALWLLTGRPDDLPELSARVFWPDELPPGADVLRTPPLRFDRWVDVTGEAGDQASVTTAGRLGARWRPMSSRRATPWEDQRSLWADLGRSRVAVVSGTPEAPWWPDALACGTLLTGELDADVPDFARAPSIQDALSQWTPGRSLELRTWALANLDWRNRLVVLGEWLDAATPELERARALLRLAGEP